MHDTRAQPLSTLDYGATMFAWILSLLHPLRRREER
jgi:hypothetical protein